jgi:hypothetical protein
MDLLDFTADDLYFDEPLTAEAEGLLAQASALYGDDPAAAEHALLRAHLLEPEHPTVLVALYRFFYYRHRPGDALRVAERVILLTARRLGIDPDWRRLDRVSLGRAVVVSMTRTRFLLMALKGAGYLCLRTGDAEGALARLEKVAALDGSDRLHLGGLVDLARARVAEQRLAGTGGNVHFLRT